MKKTERVMYMDRTDYTFAELAWLYDKIEDIYGGVDKMIMNGGAHWRYYQLMDGIVFGTPAYDPWRVYTFRGVPIEVKYR